MGDFSQVSVFISCIFVDKKGYFRHGYFYRRFQSVKQGILHSNIEYKE